MNDDALMIKRALEAEFGIPFFVKVFPEMGNQKVVVTPGYEGKQYFEISIRIKNGLRMQLEVQPEKYSAFSAADMAKAGLEKKEIFSSYAKVVKEKDASLDFTINGASVDLSHPETWPLEWRSYSCLISKFPIVGEDEDLNTTKVFVEWGLLSAGMFLSLLDVVQIADPTKVVLEGGAKQVTTNVYERNPINRELCLAANGYKCAICGFDFESAYGAIGRGFIHVHHIVPVSSMNGPCKIDPVNDMIPVCPNCHAMLHRKNPPFSPDELRAMLKESHK